MSLCYPSLLPFISPISISRQPWQYNFFSIIILRFIYVVACTNCSLLFIVIYYPFYGYAPVCLSTYLSIGIRIISRFWLLLNIFSWAYLEYLFKSLAILIGLFFTAEFDSSLYTLDAYSLSDICFTKLFLYCSFHFSNCVI